MREIKFRVWCKQSETMNTVSKIGFNEDGLWYAEDQDSDTQPPYFEGSDDWVLMQYTSINDFANNKIYEGDIVEEVVSNNPKRFEVIWDESGGMFLFAPLFATEISGAIDYYEIEETIGEIIVIGNRFENPELLEVNK